MSSWTTFRFVDSMRYNIEHDTKSMAYWCKEHCTHDWYHTSKDMPTWPSDIQYEHLFNFSNKNEAMLFKLTFVGDLM